MPSLLLIGLLAAAVPALAAAGPAREEAEAGVETAQVIFHSRVVIRVQTRTQVQTPAPWRERKGPRCVAMSDILGAAVLAPNSVDIVLRGGARVRARFAASCPGLDYYSGFYIAPPGDAKICAGRDVVRDRAGGECAIDKFRALVAPK